MTLHLFIPIWKVILFLVLTLSGREPEGSSTLPATCCLTHADARPCLHRGHHPPQSSARPLSALSCHIIYYSFCPKTVTICREVQI